MSNNLFEELCKNFVADYYNSHVDVTDGVKNFALMTYMSCGCVKHYRTIKRY